MQNTTLPRTGSSPWLLETLTPYFFVRMECAKTSVSHDVTSVQSGLRLVHRLQFSNTTGLLPEWGTRVHLLKSLCPCPFWDGVRISDGNGIATTLVNTKSKFPILLSDKNNWDRPFCLSRINDVQHEHPVELGFFDSFFWPRAVQCTIDRFYSQGGGINAMFGRCDMP